YTDILRSLVAQPIMWVLGYYLGFTAPIVSQERNPHDFLRDFELEIECYLTSSAAAQTCASAVRENLSLEENLKRVYASLIAAKLVSSSEMKYHTAKIKDLRQCTRTNYHKNFGSK